MNCCSFLLLIEFFCMKSSVTPIHVNINDKYHGNQWPYAKLARSFLRKANTTTNIMHCATKLMSWGRIYACRSCLIFN